MAAGSFLGEDLACYSHQIMPLLSKANFYAHRHAQLHWLCQVVQSHMLNVYHSPAHLFHSLLHRLSCLQQCPVPLRFPLPDVIMATDACITFG